MAGITLHAKLSGTVYCYRSCLFAMGGWALFVGGSVTTITRNCVHQSSPGFVDKGSDHLQLINDMQTPGRGSAAGQKFLDLAYYSHRAVFASLWELFSLYFVFHYVIFFSFSVIFILTVVISLLSSCSQSFCSSHVRHLTLSHCWHCLLAGCVSSTVIFVTKIKTRTRIIGRRFQRTRTRIIVIQKN